MFVKKKGMLLEDSNCGLARIQIWSLEAETSEAVEKSMIFDENKFFVVCTQFYMVCIYLQHQHGSHVNHTNMKLYM